LNIGDIRWQIAAEWLEIALWSQWIAYNKSTPLFRMVPSLTPYDLPFSKMGVANAPPTGNFTTNAAIYCEYDRRAMSPFANFWPLFNHLMGKCT